MPASYLEKTTGASAGKSGATADQDGQALGVGKRPLTAELPAAPHARTHSIPDPRGRPITELVQVHNEILTEIAATGSTARRPELDKINDEIATRHVWIGVTVIERDSAVLSDDVYVTINLPWGKIRTSSKDTPDGGLATFEISAAQLVPRDMLAASMWIEAHNERPFTDGFVTGLHWSPPFAPIKQLGGGDGRGLYRIELNW